MRVRELLKEQIKVLKTCMPDAVKKEDYGDELVEIIEMDDVERRAALDELRITGESARSLASFACGYIRGVAEERDCTILELFEEEDLP
jgi:hypothetical protein